MRRRSPTSSLLRGAGSSRRAVLLAAAALLGIAVGIITRETGALERLELRSIDTRFEIRGEQPIDDRIVIVGVNASTFSQLNRPVAPFPRALQARALRNLLEAKPRLAVYDIIFTGRTDPRNDRALFEALRAGGDRVVLGTTKYVSKGHPSIAWGANRMEAEGVGIGILNIPPDSDNVLRRMHPEIREIPTVPVLVAEVLGTQVDFEPGERLIDYAGPGGSYPELPFWKLLDGSIPPEELEDKIVVIGATDPLIHDVFTTSFGDERTAGVEIQANAIATALDGLPLAEGAGVWDLLAIVALGAGGAAAWVRGLRSATIALVLGAGYLGVTILAFNSGTVLEVVAPMLALGTAFGAAGLCELNITSLERSRARTNLMRFAPPEVASELLSSSAAPKLGGVELDATVVFVDLSGFTTFAESQTAAIVIAALNRYLGAVSDVIREHGGTIVAFLGDGVMAVFGAPIEQPDHADRAVRAAAAMREGVLEPFNAWLESEGLDERIEVGVGVSSGPVMSGLVGNEWRTEYAAVGDTTNVAARLQGEAKKRGLLLLLTEATRERMADSSGLTSVGDITLRGRAEPLTTWTVLERPVQ